MSTASRVYIFRRGVGVGDGENAHTHMHACTRTRTYIYHILPLAQPTRSGDVVCYVKYKAVYSTHKHPPTHTPTLTYVYENDIYFNTSPIDDEGRRCVVQVVNNSLHTNTHTHTDTHAHLHIHILPLAQSIRRGDVVWYRK